MSRQLTIDELKSLEVGDWVWIITLTNNGEYYEKSFASDNEGFVGYSLHYQVEELYSDYGTKWLAYKNKEQAEKYVLQRANESNGLYSIYERVEQLDLVYTCVSKHEAELRLAELKGEK